MPFTPKMEESGLKMAWTADRHFQQAGLIRLMQSQVMGTDVGSSSQPWDNLESRLLSDKSGVSLDIRAELYVPQIGAGQI
jgi:hypothetical protein